MTPKEELEQMAFVNYLRLEKLDFFSPINENEYSKYVPKKTAIMLEQKAKKMGKVSGVQDVFVYLPKVLLHIEFKRRDKKNKQSENQIKWENTVNKYSYCVYKVAYSYEEAIKFVGEYRK